MEYFVVGQVVRLTHTVLNDTGSPTNAASVTLVITLPDTTTVTTTSPTNTGTGTYRYDYTTIQAGRHTFRWDTTGPIAPDDGEFNVHGAPQGIIGLEQAKDQLRIDTTDFDEPLRQLIESVTEVIERHTGLTIVRRTETEDHHISYSPNLVLKRSPVISVTSIARVDGTLTWNINDLYVSKQTGIVTVKAGPFFSGHIEAIYIPGMAEVRSSHMDAAAMIIEHLWQTRRGTKGSARVGGMEDTVTIPGMGFAIPRAALELLGKPPPAVA